MAAARLGGKPDSLELTVEDNVLTVTVTARVERPSPPKTDGVESVIAERPNGSCSRLVVLGTNLEYRAHQGRRRGRAIPVAEKAKPRRIEVTTRSDQQEITAS